MGGLAAAILSVRQEWLQSFPTSYKLVRKTHTHFQVLVALKIYFCLNNSRQ